MLHPGTYKWCVSNYTPPSVKPHHSSLSPNSFIISVTAPTTTADWWLICGRGDNHRAENIQLRLVSSEGREVSTDYILDHIWLMELLPESVVMSLPFSSAQSASLTGRADTSVIISAVPPHHMMQIIVG